MSNSLIKLGRLPWRIGVAFLVHIQKARAQLGIISALIDWSGPILGPSLEGVYDAGTNLNSVMREKEDACQIGHWQCQSCEQENDTLTLVSLSSKKHTLAFPWQRFPLLCKDSCYIEGAVNIIARLTLPGPGNSFGLFSTWRMAVCPAPWLIRVPSGIPAAGHWTLD